MTTKITKTTHNVKNIKSDISQDPVSDFITDSMARQRALDHTKSYIVQAPAGSGKTEVLSQRVLKLLTIVNNPEEVVALTFTKKAASEMKTRILESLLNAIEESKNVENKKLEAHKLVTYNLAIKVLERNAELNWDLLDNPSRLNITTIDSLCAKIVKQTPVISDLGSEVAIIDKPEAYYKQAIYNIFGLINTQDYDKSCAWTNDFKIILEHFGCNYNRLQDFLLSMLYRREQWLPYIVNTNDANMHALMQSCWYELSSDLIRNILEIVPVNITSELDSILNYAADNISSFQDSSKPFSETQLAILSYQDSELQYWQAVSYLFFTTSAKLGFRKKLDVRMGFPAKTAFKSKEDKQKAQYYKDKLSAIISDLNSDLNNTENSTQNTELNNKESTDDLFLNFELIRQMPGFDYSKDNWSLLSILSNILKLLEAELRVIFKKNKITDFSGMAQAALYALGSSDNPSDISLYFDYAINHLLVDEFQDTSYTQYQLLEKLTHHWVDNISPNLDSPRKTIFLVGDPMQSIYRFRQAEVGLFLQVKNNGLGHLKLDYLALTKNFRSEQQIVDWVNTKFNNILPSKSNILFGAISYNNSEATKKLDNNLRPNLKLFARAESLNNVYKAENDFIINKIQSLISTDGGTESDNVNNNEPISIAILVRNRSKIVDLILDLKKNNLNISAVDIECLSDRMVIKDLLSLTKSILDLSDRTAWYSVLRAPWCGLSLEDLYMLNFGNEDKSIWQILSSSELNNLLNSRHEVEISTTSHFNPDSKSESITAKIDNIKLVYNNVFSKLYKTSFYKLIEQAWYALGGNIIYNTPEDLSDANQFFELIFQLEKSNMITDLNQLLDEVGNLYSKTNNTNLNNNFAQQFTSNYVINIMTIHKSKGLQFDYVFLPYLDSMAKSNEHQMLAWQQYHNNNIAGVLLAPYHVKENEQIKFYEAIRYIEQQKESFELARLFYVAVTRAIKSCVLSASLEQDKLEELAEIYNNIDHHETDDVDTRHKVNISSKSMLGKIFFHLEHEEISINITNADSIKHHHGKLSGEFDINWTANMPVRYLDPKSYNLNILLNNIYKQHSNNPQLDKVNKKQLNLREVPESDDLSNYMLYLKSKTKDLFLSDTITDNPQHYPLEDTTDRIIGTFVHKIFYNITQRFLDINSILDSQNNINNNLLANWRSRLLNQGIGLDKINKALDLVKIAVKNTLLDTKGRWILSGYKYSYSELELHYKTRLNKSKINKSIIDRVFIDNNIIYIIDYKISQDANFDSATKKQYQSQLEHYGYLVSKKFLGLIKDKNLSIKLALYFPLLDAAHNFISWNYHSSPTMLD